MPRHEAHFHRRGLPAQPPMMPMRAKSTCPGRESPFSAVKRVRRRGLFRGKTVFRVALKLPAGRAARLATIMLGPGADEILRGCTVAIGMGATRAGFEQTVGHPPDVRRGARYDGRLGPELRRQTDAARRVLSDCHFSVQRNHFIPVFLLCSVAVFLK